MSLPGPRCPHFALCPRTGQDLEGGNRDMGHRLRPKRAQRGAGSHCEPSSARCASPQHACTGRPPGIHTPRGHSHSGTRVQACTVALAHRPVVRHPPQHTWAHLHGFSNSYQTHTSRRSPSNRPILTSLGHGSTCAHRAQHVTPTHTFIYLFINKYLFSSTVWGPGTQRQERENPGPCGALSSSMHAYT